MMPAYGLFKTEKEINSMYTLIATSAEKLTENEQLNNKESSFVALSVDSAFKALRNEFPASQEIIASLTPYLFTIIKLHPYFESVLSMIP